jgi:hypothetical protein
MTTTKTTTALARLFMAQQIFHNIERIGFQSVQNASDEANKAALEMYNKMMYDIRAAAAKHLCDAEIEHAREILNEDNKN